MWVFVLCMSFERIRSYLDSGYWDLIITGEAWKLKVSSWKNIRKQTNNSLAGCDLKDDEMLSLHGFALSWSWEFNLLGPSFNIKCSPFPTSQEFERSFLNKILTTKAHSRPPSLQSWLTQNWCEFQHPDVTSSPHRRISAAFWRPWTPTSRSRACTTSIGWTCTPSTIWGSSPRTSSLWLMNATVASGSAMTASVCSSGQCQTWWNKCWWLSEEMGINPLFVSEIHSIRKKNNELAAIWGTDTVRICSVFKLSACKTLVLSKLTDVPNSPGQLACWGFKMGGGDKVKIYDGSECF